jgi:hypothetical protein
MTTLPYENATSGKNALNEMQKILRGFGAASFGVMDDYAKGAVIVQFTYRERTISISANWKGYAAAWLRIHPQSSRSHMTVEEYEQRALKQGEIAVYSILRDWIKGQITAVEVGMLSFEGAFLGQIMLPTGETVLQRVTQQHLLEAPA